MYIKKLKKYKIKIILYLVLLSTVYCSLPTAVYALGVKREVFENGLTLMIVERHNLPIVKVVVGIDAGNLHEPEEKAGLANLTAGLLTSGTGGRTAKQISEQIEFVGGSVEASGGDDYITASLSILKKDLELGFELLSDILLNPVFPEKELDKKKERIKGSLKAREEDPGFVASKNFKKTIFGSHPYGRLITGTEDTLDKITREDLLDFHSQYYMPENTIIAVVGDITVQEVYELINKYFNKFIPKNIKTFSFPEIGDIKHKKTIAIDKELTQANILLGHIGVKRDNPDYYAISVMNYILGGGGFASRLMQNIREDKGLVYDIYSYFSADKYGGRFQIGLQTKNESTNTAIKEIISEVNKIRNQPVSDIELADAKAFLTGSFPLRIETGSKIASFLVAVEYYGLGVDYIDNYPGYINSITKEDILRAAIKYLDPDNFILVIVADQKKVSLHDDFK